MNLRTGCVYWTQRALDPPLHCPPLDRDIQTDVAILGAGITGAMVAHELIAAGVDCLLLDRRDVGRGSTAASTGLLQYEIDKPLASLIQAVGIQHAQRAYQMGVEALSEFERLAGVLGDDCGFARTTSLFLGTSPDSIDTLHAECRARQAAGINVQFLDDTALRVRYGFSRPAAILSADAAVIDPFRFTTRLLQHNLARGLRAFGDTLVTLYDPSPDGVTLVTQRGPRIRARQVVFATGYETPEFVRDLPVRLKTTYALATAPHASIAANPTAWPLLWETGTPYFYVRPVDGNRLMVGGEDDDSNDPQLRQSHLPAKAAALTRKLHAMFPGIDFQPDCVWGGTFAESPDGLPYIGPHHRFPAGLFALGYGGNGITFGLIAAQLLSRHIQGHPDPDESIFRLDR